VSRGRKVTKLTRERAFSSIKIIAKAAMDGEIAVSYSELASRLGMPNDTGRGLGPILDEAAHMCLEFNLPDVSALVVTKTSLETGIPMPSEDSFIDGVWPITGMKIESIPAEQDRVRSFDWTKVPSLKLV